MTAVVLQYDGGSSMTMAVVQYGGSGMTVVVV